MVLLAFFQTTCIRIQLIPFDEGKSKWTDSGDAYETPLVAFDPGCSFLNARQVVSSVKTSVYRNDLFQELNQDPNLQQNFAQSIC